jgi:class 3 adenylate cyclase/predicted ATPase
MRCPACQTENEPGRKFCAECGSALARSCPACGTANAPTAKFCGECGSALTAESPAVRSPTPGAERRLVSVLFADLAGYTALSEGRDFEDVRDLQTRYFETARTVVARYGGTVEKFIGDAVMALWGAPVAREDDAERAVRAALDLVDAVDALAGDTGTPDLKLRAGVLTGEAAVAVGADGQGMVTGDLVNTASRVQAAAEPGTVLVGDATRRASAAAIAYADAGERELKGKSEPVHLWQALRVEAQRRGEGRSAGLEAPFVGRAAELRLVKDLFHASADERRARLVSVVGVAGIGKSRLSWEFEKYLDGLAGDVWWHRGRCLSYGDGVAFWALGEMVRGRARILEDDDAPTAVSKLREMLDLYVADEEERAWVEPRLLHLLGLTERTAPDREDLFSAWRRLFERIAEQGPLVMVFEDLHWADEGLVAFVEYLLDWARHHPIFVITLSRPEIADRHPHFPGSTRSATTLPLDPLDDEAMDELLTGLVPGLPDDLRTRLREAADGIPLYAVETVRMLRDRGLLDQVGDEVVLAGDVTALQVPETLHALIASRLDGLPEAERRLLQDAAVLGKTFTRRGLAALSELAEDEVEPLVTALVRKELLALETDPFSPERGQLGFLQALIQRVAYDTIARRDRKARHLAAAQYLAADAGLDPDEIAEVIASHYLDAREADPDADDADDVRAQARHWFTRAADRAASLAASLEAQRAFERAAGLAAGEAERGLSLARAGELALMGGRLDEAEQLLREAIEILAAAGMPSAASAEANLGELLFATERIEEAVSRLEGALRVYEAEADEAATATVSAQLARFLFFEGRGDDALPHVERALELSERLRLGPVIVEALINKALILDNRPNESLGLMRQALALAEESGLDRGAVRACMNLGYLLSLVDREAEAMEVTVRGLAIARRRGDRVWERSLLTNLISSRIRTGQWDEAAQAATEIPDDGSIVTDPVQAYMQLDLAVLALRRGENERAAELAGPYASWRDSARVQARGVGVWARALVASASGRYAEVVAECAAALADEQIFSQPIVVEILGEAGFEAAWAERDLDGLTELLDPVAAASNQMHSTLEARVRLQQARVAVLRGDPEPPFELAVAAFRRTGEPYWVATALLEQAEWLADHGRADEIEPLVAEAADVFERLRVAPGLERIARLQPEAALA